MPKTRSATKKNEDSSSSATSRQSPASNPDVSALTLPAPSTTRNLPPRLRVTRSQASSRRGSYSAASSRSSSVFVGDSEGPVTRQRKKRRLGANDTYWSAGGTSGSSHLNAGPRPAWRNSDEEDENTDQLDGSDIEEVGMGWAPALDAQGEAHQMPGSSAQIASDQPVARSSARHRSSSSPPLTALSPIQETIVEHLPTSQGASSSTVSGFGSGSRGGRPRPHETAASPVSSPSLMKIINQTNISPGSVPSKRKRASPSPDTDIIEILHLPTKDKGKGKAKAVSLSPTPPPETQKEPSAPEQEPLSEYTCPICFFPPSNATLTPCGHRSANMGMAVGVGENVARCPVCRAIIPGWDGKGGGVIGLKVRQVISL
ncbi:E3 ubiquitin-protein ligase complex slx8-rfp subunit slx8 [Leucoagaricus sp. SymC.cos]|nr:E3 ubiquitin-protein ligase complex slx8-rfp subunit slx8 [Leucoagaricus sp. SymC.cos]